MAFQIKPNKKESENKTIRFPIEIIEEINEAIAGKDVSFSNFVIQACEYALDNLENKEEWNIDRWVLENGGDVYDYDLLLYDGGW